MKIKNYDVLLDPEDEEKYGHWIWHVIPQTVNRTKFRVRGYLKGKGNQNKRQYLHRVVLNISDPNIEIDHINGNTLDNRKENLRSLNRHHNQGNRQQKNRNNSTGFLGVTRQHGKFIAQIFIDWACIRIGKFDTAEEASAAYIATRKEWYGGE